MSGLLARDHMYGTVPARQRWEAMARANIVCELDSLTVGSALTRPASRRRQEQNHAAASSAATDDILPVSAGQAAQDAQRAGKATTMRSALTLTTRCQERYPLTACRSPG